VITTLTLTDFRSYASATLPIGAGAVVLHGPNGAGKTNLLEALSLFTPGKGLRGAKLKDEDRVDHLFIASTHDFLLFFTNQGRVYRQKVHEIPSAARDARGRHIANVLALLPDEEIRQVFNTRDYGEGKYLVLATKAGMVKKTEFSAYNTVLKDAGIIAIRLTDGDELVGVQLTDGEADLLIVSARGQAARFAEEQVRST
jgi:DNA gyrase subunit A